MSASAIILRAFSKFTVIMAVSKTTLTLFLHFVQTARPAGVGQAGGSGGRPVAASSRHCSSRPVLGVGGSGRLSTFVIVVVVL